MLNEVAVIFTFKNVERVLREGGTSSWRLDRNHARKCSFAVLTRNAKSRRTEGPEAHRAAFMVGKVKDVVPAPDRPQRFLIQFSEYALVSLPNVWKKDRNPVKYASSLGDLGIDPSSLKWKRMPEQATSAEATRGTSAVAGALTMAEAKNGLSLMFGVPPEAIEITIRG